MIYKHDYQRMALDTDRMMITCNSKDYHDYSNNKLACIYVKWAEEHCPERLQAEADKGKIYVHIDERITECEKEKWKIWQIRLRFGSLKISLSCRLRRLRFRRVWQYKIIDEIKNSIFSFHTHMIEYTHTRVLITPVWVYLNLLICN